MKSLSLDMVSVEHYVFMGCSSVLVTELGKYSSMMQKHLVFITNSLRFQDQMRAKRLGMQFPIYFIVCGLCIELVTLVTL